MSMPSSQAEPFTFHKSDARRTDSFGSDSSGSDKDVPKPSHISWIRKHSISSPKPHNSPTVNCYTHCGRHTDQFLFGGHSLLDLIRKKN